MKTVIFSRHALSHMSDRGTTEEEVVQAIRAGERADAEHGRLAFRKNLLFHSEWKGKSYATKQVRPIVVEEPERFVVVTVYVYYFGENP